MDYPGFAIAKAMQCACVQSIERCPRARSTLHSRMIECIIIEVAAAAAAVQIIGILIDSSGARVQTQILSPTE